jgi:hypothetical protein
VETVENIVDMSGLFVCFESHKEVLTHLATVTVTVDRAAKAINVLAYLKINLLILRT